MKVSALTEKERARIQECLRWLHTQSFTTDELYRKALKEAGDRWPDVKELIGWTD